MRSLSNLPFIILNRNNIPLGRSSVDMNGALPKHLRCVPAEKVWPIEPDIRRKSQADIFDESRRNPNLRVNPVFTVNKAQFRARHNWANSLPNFLSLI